MRRFFVEVMLDASAEGGNNEQEQLNNNTNDHPTKRLPDQPATMDVTPNHPVYVEGKGWLWAENLAVGEKQHFH